MYAYKDQFTSQTKVRGEKKKREGEGERERRQNVQIFMSTLFLASSYHLASIWLMNKLGWIQSNL